MSNLKMSECFSMPLTIEMHRDYCDEFEAVVKDSVGDFIFIMPEDVDTDAVVHAINSHDDLVAQIAELTKQRDEFKAGVEYAIDNFGYRTSIKDDLCSYKQQEQEVQHLMDVIAKAGK